MIAKTALRETIAEVLENNEIDNRAFADDLLDRLVQDFGEEIYDDEDEEDEEEEALGSAYADED